MEIYSVQYLPNKNYELLGIVKGNTVQSKNIARDIGASFKNLIGGELKAYTEMLKEAREIAQERMEAEAAKLGADAVIGVNFTGGQVTEGTAEIVCYGTAIKYI